MKVFSIFFLFIFILLLASGCGKRQMIVYNQPEAISGGYYETAWINPQILISDTLYTLIKAERIDSFYVEQPTELLKEPRASLTIVITEESCFATINLLNDQGVIIKPLLARKLRSGYYKITCNIDRVNVGLSRTGFYFIKADYCGFSVVERVTRQ